MASVHINHVYPHRSYPQRALLLFAALSLLTCARLIAQDFDRDCIPGLPECRQLAEDVSNAQAAVNDIDDQIRELQSQLKDSSGSEKSGIMSRVRALQRQRPGAARNLTEKQSQLARCRTQNTRPIAPSTLQSSMVGTAYLSINPQTISTGAERFVISERQPIIFQFDRSRCGVLLQTLPKLEFHAPFSPGLGDLIFVQDTNHPASAGRFHPLSGAMENIPIEVGVTSNADSSVFHVVETITISLFTTDPDPFGSGPLKPDGSLILTTDDFDIGFFNTVTNQPDSKSVFLAIYGTLSPHP